MKQLIITICFSIIFLSAHATDPTPITKDSIIKLKTIERALDLSPAYHVAQYTYVLVRAGNVFKSTCNSDLLGVEIEALISGTKKGDKISFEDVIATKDGHRIKVEGKTFIFL